MLHFKKLPMVEGLNSSSNYIFISYFNLFSLATWITSFPPVYPFYLSISLSFLLFLSSFPSLPFHSMKIDPSSTNNLWNVVFGMGIMWCGNYCTSQTEVQRYCNVQSKRKAKMYELHFNYSNLLMIIQHYIIM